MYKWAGHHKSIKLKRRTLRTALTVGGMRAAHRTGHAVKAGSRVASHLATPPSFTYMGIIAWLVRLTAVAVVLATMVTIVAVMVVILIGREIVRSIGRRYSAPLVGAA